MCSGEPFGASGSPLPTSRSIQPAAFWNEIFPVLQKHLYYFECAGIGAHDAFSRYIDQVPAADVSGFPEMKTGSSSTVFAGPLLRHLVKNGAF